MAQNLARQRCFNHASREAAARCPECGRYYCRECVTEHDGRLLCASCVEKLAQKGKTDATKLGLAGRLILLASSFLILWFSFYAFGRLLALTPSEFHETSIWRDGISE